MSIFLFLFEMILYFIFCFAIRLVYPSCHSEHKDRGND